VTLEDEVATLRRSCALTELGHVVALRLTGAATFELLDALSSRPLFLRESQMCHSLFLREDARPLADVYLCSGEDAFYLLAEGPSEAELVDHLERHRARAGAEAVQIETLSSTHTLFGVNGPYAWELVSALLGPSVLGMPYLSLLHHERATCFRSGKTGEYGYDLLVPRAEAAALRADLERLGRSLELRKVGVAALDHCALENWFFSMRHLRDTTLAEPLTPLELQLQWRVSYDRDYVGADALRARRARGIEVRTSSVSSEAELSPGQRVQLGSQDVGEVLAAGRSALLGRHVGVALLATRLAHPGVTGLSAHGAALRVHSPPLINNRSLHVDVHRHSYATRHADTFPELVPA
jgi:glycine cleavage system aminomethyltransferase T